jgi:acetyl-CoA acyltransferase
MLVLCDEATAQRRGWQPLASIEAATAVGCDPKLMGIGPVHATRRLCDQQHLQLEDFDTIELNEAFAAQSLACVRALGLDPARVNVNGGAIALGHPLGCTGAKLTATLLNELKRTGGRYGAVSMCIGGGMGAAGIFERA